jgi:hypothetical protein
MYKALKSAQSEIQEVLLKFADEAGMVVREKTDTSRCSRSEQCQCAMMTQSVPKASPTEDIRLQGIEDTLQFLHQKQNGQYEVLVGGIQQINVSLSNIVKILSEQRRDAIETATIIPNVAPSAKSSELKDVCVDTGFGHVGDLSDLPKTLESPYDLDEGEQSAIEGDEETPDMEDAEEEEEEDVVPEEEEEGIEVEEWTYKGRNFFKDTENTVYANNNGELGDPIGLYDPVKNIVKKLATSS